MPENQEIFGHLRRALFDLEDLSSDRILKVPVDT